MTKKNTLSAGLSLAAGKRVESDSVTPAAKTQPATPKPATVLIAAHFVPEVRRVLKLLEADTGRNLKQLLGEAINDLAAKYGKPEPFTNEE